MSLIWMDFCSYIVEVDLGMNCEIELCATTLYYIA